MQFSSFVCLICLAVPGVNAKWIKVQTIGIFDSFATVTGAGHKHKKAFLTEKKGYTRPGSSEQMGNYNLTMEPGDYLAFYGVNIAFRYIG